MPPATIRLSRHELSSTLRNVNKTTQDYVADNTTLGIPALLQKKETHCLLFGNATTSTHQLGTHARGILVWIEKMGADIAPQSSTLGTYMHHWVILLVG
jgi:hypothetical protein